MERTKTMVEYLEVPMILTFLGALLAAIGAIWASVRQNEEKIGSAKERVAFEQELRAKSDEIAELNRTVSSNVTGGDSYCYLFISNPSKRNSRAMVIVMTEGRFPLYDVNVKLDDVDRLISIVKERHENGLVESETWEQSRDAVNQASNHLRIGNIGPSQAMDVGAIQFPEGDTFRLNIEITARNGRVVQVFRFRKIDERWERAERILFNDNVVKEEISEGFPQELRDAW